MLHTLNTTYWEEPFSAKDQQNATIALEEGKIVFFPQLSFQLKSYEQPLLSAEILAKKSKNISFDPETQVIQGVKDETKARQIRMLMDRFFDQTYNFVETLFPQYRGKLIKGCTSYFPLEVGDRETSVLKDDARLHVDAFATTPNQGKRILAVFSNINPKEKKSLWYVGEPFEKIINQFSKDLRKPLFGSRALLRLFGGTKTYRSLYDHYMLMLHDLMKKNEDYQKTALKTEVHFPSRSTWILMTDSVSHATLSGQFMLEQTFYLPPDKMLSPEQSPIFILKKSLNQNL